MTARNRGSLGRCLLAFWGLVLLLVLLYAGHKVVTGRRQLCVVSNNERRSLTLYDIRGKSLIVWLCMDDGGTDVPIQYAELTNRDMYAYVNATASSAVFEAVWRDIAKGQPIPRNGDLGNVSGCILFNGGMVQNVQVARAGSLARTIIQEAGRSKTREVPYEKGEEWRLHIISVSTNLWRLRGHFGWADD